MRRHAALLAALGSATGGLTGATDPRGEGSAIFCASQDCWHASAWTADAAATSAPLIILESSAAAEAYKAGSSSNVSLVPSLSPLWERRPQAASPLPPDKLWDTTCKALLGCYDTLLMQPQPFPDIAQGSPAGISIVMWVQGHPIHGGDVYATLLDKAKTIGVRAAVTADGAQIEIALLASMAAQPYNLSLSTSGCGAASLFDDKPHQVAFILDGDARLASLMVDDALCAAGTVGWASWNPNATAPDIKHLYATYFERGLSQLTIYPRTLLTSEVLGGFYAGAPAGDTGAATDV